MPPYSARALGYDSMVGTSLRDITETGINVPLPSTALAMEVLSSSANDVGTTLSSGTATGGSALTLIDLGATFSTDSVAAGDYVINATDGCHATVLTVDSESHITFSVALASGTTGAFAAGDTYNIVRAGASGAAVMAVHGLDGEFVEIAEFIVMNDTTPVVLANKYRRINVFHVMHVGSGRVSSGNIDLRQINNPANIMSRVSAGGNMQLQCHFTVPASRTMYLYGWSAGSGGVKPIRAILRITADFSNRDYMDSLFHFTDIMLLKTGTVPRTFRTPLKVPGRADVKVSANVIGMGTGEASASFEFWLE